VGGDPDSSEGPREDELVLRPPECRSREQVERELAEPIELPGPAPRGPPPQFSLRDIMVLTVGVAAGLAGGSWMPGKLFAALLGLATLIGLLVVSLRPPETRAGKLVWASFVIAYFTAVVAALLRPPTNSAP
jgi:hypothetical protein